MHHHFDDIRERINDSPKWWDENGVPRYCEFSPAETANIYRNECALCIIACQDCRHEFSVALSEDEMRMVHGRPSLAELIESGELHYGDPPNIHCCPAGPTMSSVMMRVVEFWKKPDGEYDLKRDQTREISFDH